MTLLVALLLGQAVDTEADKAARVVLRECGDVLRKTDATLDEKRAAVKKAGETKHWIVAKGLGELLAQPAPEIRIEAARALGTMKELPKATEALLPALSHDSNKKRTDVRIEIVRALAALGRKEILPTIHPLVKDNDVFVAREVITTLPSYKSEASVKVLIDWLMTVEREPDNQTKLVIDFNLGDVELPDFENYKYPMYDFEIRASVDDIQRIRNSVLHEPLLKTLQTATGKTLTTYRGWSEWWRKDGGTFKFPK